MIEPPSFRSGKAFCTVNSVPLTLMLKSRSKCSSVTAPKGTNSPTPALANTISMLLRLSDALVQTIKVSQLVNVALHSSNVGADGLRWPVLSEHSSCRAPSTIPRCPTRFWRRRPRNSDGADWGDRCRTTPTERRPSYYAPSAWLPTRLLVRPFQLVEA